MLVSPHRVNFEPRGAWYTLEDGRGIYLAHRRMGQVYAKRNAWAIERIALEDTQRLNIEWAGVVVKQGKRKWIWATRVEDFFGANSFTHPDNILQRCLPLNRFLVTPMMNMEIIEASMKLR